MSHVISFVSPKGGSGKTTSALLLAGQIVSRSKQKVVIVDADPNKPFGRWEKISGGHEQIIVLDYDSSEEILDVIDKAKTLGTFIFVDLEGSRNENMSFTISQSDLILIPMQGSMLDADQAGQAVAYIKQIERSYNRRFNYRAFFTRVNAAFTTRNLNDIQSQFEKANVPLLKARLAEREAFKTVFACGKVLEDLFDNDVSGLDKAIKDAMFFLANVMEALKEVRSANKEVA